MGHNRTRTKRTGRQGLTAEQRAQYVKERQNIIGRLLTQEGFQGALVIAHVRGSQYELRMPDGETLYASHKKQKGQDAVGAISSAGWQRWEDR